MYAIQPTSFHLYPFDTQISGNRVIFGCIHVLLQNSYKTTKPLTSKGFVNKMLWRIPDSNR